MSLTLDLSIEDAGWTEEIADPETLLEKALAAAARRLSGENVISLALMDDATIKTLNQQWRGKDKPTDVLSFPADPVFAPFRGDIAIALGVSRRDAETRNLPLADHLCHLAIHGFLHLRGFDHETEAEAEKMETLEREVLASLGLHDPYPLTNIGM